MTAQIDLQLSPEVRARLEATWKALRAALAAFARRLREWWQLIPAEIRRRATWTEGRVWVNDPRVRTQLLRRDRRADRRNASLPPRPPELRLEPVAPPRLLALPAVWR